MLDFDRAIEILTPGTAWRNPGEYEEAHMMAIQALKMIKYDNGLTLKYQRMLRNVEKAGGNRG